MSIMENICETFVKFKQITTEIADTETQGHMRLENNHLKTTHSVRDST